MSTINEVSTTLESTRVVTGGSLMDKNNFLSSYEAAQPLREFLSVNVDRKLVEERGLEALLTIPDEKVYGYVCLPTTTLMALRHLSGKRESVDLPSFYEIGILSHVNDRPERGGFRKGYPSFHRVGRDAYLQFALDFVRVAGLFGGIVTEFENLDFANTVIEKGGVVALSVDNLFIPNVMNPTIDPSTFSPSRHAELLHALSGDRVVLSDVSNRRGEQTWQTTNKVVETPDLIRHIYCPRLNDNLSRALVIAPTKFVWDDVGAAINTEKNILIDRPNPILREYFGMGIKPTLESMRLYWNKRRMNTWDWIDMIGLEQSELEII